MKKTRREMIKVTGAAVAATVGVPAAAVVALPVPAIDPSCHYWVKAAAATAKAMAKPIRYGKLNYALIAGEGGGRDLVGRPLEYLPLIYGDGIHDDAPGLNALIADRCVERLKDASLRELEAHICPSLPADRLYRIESPIISRGALNFSPAGYKFETVFFPFDGHHWPHCEMHEGGLSSGFEPGEIRFFWFDFADGDPERDTTLRIRVLKS